MNDNSQLDATKVASSMPTPYVEFVEQLWRTQEEDSRHTWGRELVVARRPVFLRLLASRELAAELRRAYETPVGVKIAKTLTCQAVHIPELWTTEDKRTKEERAAQVESLRSAAKTVVAILDEDRSVPDERGDQTEKVTTEAAVPREPRARRSSSKIDARSPGSVRLIFEDVVTKPVFVGRCCGPGMKVALSVYEIHEALRALDKPLHQMVKNINEFRTHKIDDPLARNIGQVTKGNSYIRHALLLLDLSIDKFAADFARFGRKLSRDKLLGAFVKAIYPKTEDDVISPKAINQIRRKRRKSKIER